MMILQIDVSLIPVIIMPLVFPLFGIVSQSNSWEVVTHSSGVLVDISCKEGQEHAVNVKKLVDRLRDTGSIH
jgi:hypothetical protein